MRIVMTLATLLALSYGAYAGDDAPGVNSELHEVSGKCIKFNFGEGANFNITPVGGELCRCNPPLGGQAEFDTSVYHLEHAHARQLIGRVKSLVAQIAAYAADENVGELPKSLMLMPTTSDDTIIAICPRAHASLVKDAIKSCDTLKQYAVKVQLFEVADSGKTIPVGGPHLLIGREGTVQCTMPEESVSVNFKVDTPLVDANTEVAPCSNDTETAGTQASAAFEAGRCRLDCPPPIGEMAVESECGACSESCCQSGTCAACKTGTCTSDCCKAGCCHGQAAAGCCKANGCKCDGSCCASGQSAEESHETTSYEETSTLTPFAMISSRQTECPACHSGHRFSVGFGFGSGCPGLHFVGPIVWFNKGDEPRCAGCEAQREVADSDDGHDGDANDMISMVPPAPSDAPAPNSGFVVTKDGNCFIFNSAPAPEGSPADIICQTQSVVAPSIVFQGPGECAKSGNCASSCTGGCSAVTLYEEAAQLTTNASGDLCDPAKLAKSQGRLTGAKVFSVGDAGVYIEQRQSASPTGSSCTDGCPILVSGTDEAPAASNAPSCCEDAQQAPGAEPPALLTLSQHKDPSSTLSIPHWQEELLKAFRGRRLSELFEPRTGQTPSGHELGRLLAEFPKSGGAHSLTIVDTPARVQIFQCDASAFEPEKLPETAKAPGFNTCPNCREEFRAFLEEMFRPSPEGAEDIAQTAHHEGDSKPGEAARDLPNVTHSKIAAETRSYPLRDLVLCDDAGRPVFDTCTIIDHLQSAVAPESWSHPSVSIQLDQQSVSLVVTQTAEVHQKIADHLHYLRRLQIKQICNLIERLSGDDADPSVPSEAAALGPDDVELGPALHVGGK